MNYNSDKWSNYIGNRLRKKGRLSSSDSWNEKKGGKIDEFAEKTSLLISLPQNSADKRGKRSQDKQDTPFDAFSCIKGRIIIAETSLGISSKKFPCSPQAAVCFLRDSRSPDSRAFGKNAALLPPPWWRLGQSESLVGASHPPKTEAPVFRFPCRDMPDSGRSNLKTDIHPRKSYTAEYRRFFLPSQWPCTPAQPFSA